MTYSFSWQLARPIAKSPSLIKVTEYGIQSIVAVNICNHAVPNQVQPQVQ